MSDTSWLKRHELMEELYYQRFKRLAPGKSEPPELARESCSEENREQYENWLLCGQAVTDLQNYALRLEEELERWQRERFQ